MIPQRTTVPGTRREELKGPLIPKPKRLKRTVKSDLGMTKKIANSHRGAAGTRIATKGEGNNDVDSEDEVVKMAIVATVLLQMIFVKLTRTYQG